MTLTVHFSLAEEVGFEPTCPFERHLSKMVRLAALPLLHSKVVYAVSYSCFSAKQFASVDSSKKSVD